MKTKPTSLRVAAAQLTPSYLDLEGTLEKACAAIAEAAAGGARLVVFPEVFLSGYPDWCWVVPNYRGDVLNPLYQRLLDNAVSVPDGATEQICKAARKHKIHVVMGLHERNSEASGASLFNSLLFIDDRGEILGRHRKLIPTGAERLIWGRGPGGDLKVFRTSVGKVGGLICWENYMPLARQVLYDQGVQILAAPTWDKSDNWLLSMRHIAREGGTFVISCCMALRFEDLPEDAGFREFYPSERVWVNPGNSCIIDPLGRIVAGPLSEAEGLLFADLDMTLIAAAKRLFDVAGHYAWRASGIGR
ncbi:MAG: carbon-nitrogen hydrolase family protein [Bacteroidetes bacterium]|nr:MAG: carbon-nitrogen hydrolase family protein [Bacteroidota bacterium]